MATPKASPLPLLVGAFSVFGSIFIAAVVFMRFSFAPRELSYLGWFLTPLAVFLALAFDFYLQRKGRANPNFIIRPKYTAILSVLSYASLVLAGFHIWVVAEMLSAS